MKTNPTSGPSALAALEQLEGLTQSVDSVADALHALGTNGSTSMGAIELLSKEVMDGTEKLTNFLAAAADDIKSGLDELAEAVYALATAVEKEPGKTEADRDARFKAFIKPLLVDTSAPTASRES
jgi:hypothetical protein